MKKIIFVMVALTFFTFCTGRKEYVEKRLRSYVMVYYDADNIALDASPNSTYFSNKAVIEIDLILKGQIGSYKDAGASAEKAAYDALCEKHGDMTYNRKVLVGEARSVNYSGVDFTSIEVTGDADYDAGHPAGSSLNGIMSFFIYSSKPYIDSGYTEYTEASEIYRYSRILKALDEIASDDLMLLGTGRIGYDPPNKRYAGRIGTLIFDQNPTLEKTHTFTVTMTPDDGRDPFTASVEMTFE